MAPDPQKARLFLALHAGPDPLLVPNAWDAGSAKLLASLGFRALATTSSGVAATLGRVDGGITLAEALAANEAIAAATDLPVSADLEDCFGSAPDDVARTVRAAAEIGLAGCSVEDGTRDAGAGDPVYDIGLAAERVAAAVDAAHAGPARLVLTARAENHVVGRDDLDDTIARLRRYEAAGADVLFAPGLRTADAVRRIVDAVGVPVSVLVRPGLPPIAELAALGVRRFSVGGSMAFAAIARVVDAATELRDRGTYGWFADVPGGVGAARSAFGG